MVSSQELEAELRSKSDAELEEIRALNDSVRSRKAGAELVRRSAAQGSEAKWTGRASLALSVVAIVISIVAIFST